MIPRLPAHEIIQDYQDTLTDIEHLSLIVQGLQGFTNNPGGEDRGKFRTDLWRYEGILRDARGLKHRIEETAHENGVTLPELGEAAS